LRAGGSSEDAFSPTTFFELAFFEPVGVVFLTFPFFFDAAAFSRRGWLTLAQGSRVFSFDFSF